jgi:hypothetical protein
MPIASPAGLVPAAGAPGPDNSLRARGAALAAQSAWLRAEITATRHDVAQTLDMLAVTLDHLADRYPVRAIQLRARSESARALAARTRPQLP